MRQVKTFTVRRVGLLDEDRPDKDQFVKERITANMATHHGNKRLRKKKAKQSLGLLYEILYGGEDFVFEVVSDT